MNTMVNSSKGEIKIFDLTGRIVKQINNVEWYEGTPVQVPCNELNGIYMVEVHSGTSRFVGKVIMH
ncbi:MAG: T9SS type A sorting domain-containing protein [Bacteroidales bacterium]|nr:T9SS type A sorting domain-containing protein [Bacteroidales bacterium]